MQADLAINRDINLIKSIYLEQRLYAFVCEPQQSCCMLQHTYFTHPPAFRSASASLWTAGTTGRRAGSQRIAAAAGCPRQYEGCAALRCASCSASALGVGAAVANTYAVVVLCLESINIVTGPEFSLLTSIIAPNTPSFTLSSALVLRLSIPQKSAYISLAGSGAMAACVHTVVGPQLSERKRTKRERGREGKTCGTHRCESRPCSL